MNAKLTQDELQAIKERAEKAHPAAYSILAYKSVAEDIPKLLAEIERLQAEVHEHSAHNGQLIATHVIPTKEENKRLRKALEFYAQIQKFAEIAEHGYNSELSRDGGHIAREALK